MPNEASTSDDAAMADLGRRIAAARLARSMTQAELALEAGISKSTLERLEAGKSTQLTAFVRCLRALGRLNALTALLPDPQANPIEQLTRDRPRRIRSRRERPAAPTARWRWGDET